MKSLAVGSLVVHPIFDGTARLNTAMLTNPDGSAPTWNAQPEGTDDAGDFVVPVGGYVVRTGDRTVLLDTGVGPITDDMFVGGELLNSLAAVGVEPDDIDTVFVSHLHSDHMGWLELHGAATFRNATVHIGAGDWQHFVEEAASGQDRADRLRSIESHISLIDTDDVTVAPGITSRMTPGHTPGHMSAVIADSGERLIMLGDVVHCPAQLTETEWHFLSDVDPTLAARTRATMVHEADEAHTTLLPCHFPDMHGARLVVADDAQKRWTFS